MPARLSRLVTVMLVMTLAGSWLTLWPVTYGLGATKRLTARTGVLTGHVLIGPITPIVKADEPAPAVPPEMFTSRHVEIRHSAQGTVLRRVRLSAVGTYRVRLAPGTYVVEVVPGGFTKGKGPLTVQVRRGTITEASFEIDTGMQ